MVLDKDGHMSGKNVKFSCLFRKIRNSKLVRFHAGVFGLFFAITSGLKNMIFQNQLQTLKEN